MNFVSMLHQRNRCFDVILSGFKPRHMPNADYRDAPIFELSEKGERGVIAFWMRIFQRIFIPEMFKQKACCGK